MSLDIHLQGETREVNCVCGSCGDNHKKTETEEFFWQNITYNLNEMAKEAGIYSIIWRPEENGIKRAAQLIEPLKAGIELLKSDPKRFIALEPDNKWGTYADFVPWLEQYLRACEEYPEATVYACR
jgi:hypothetical protein